MSLIRRKKKGEVKNQQVKTKAKEQNIFFKGALGKQDIFIMQCILV